MIDKYTMENCNLVLNLSTITIAVFSLQNLICLLSQDTERKINKQTELNIRIKKRLNHVKGWAILV